METFGPSATASIGRLSDTHIRISTNCAIQVICHNSYTNDAAVDPSTTDISTSPFCIIWFDVCGLQSTTTKDGIWAWYANIMLL